MPLAIQPAINAAVPGQTGIAGARATSASGQSSFAASFGAQIQAPMSTTPSPATASGTPPENGSGGQAANVLSRKNPAKNNSPASLNLSASAAMATMPPVPAPRIPNAFVGTLNPDLGNSAMQAGVERNHQSNAGGENNSSISALGQSSTSLEVNPTAPSSETKDNSASIAAETQTLNQTAANSGVASPIPALASTNEVGSDFSEPLFAEPAVTMSVGDAPDAEVSGEKAKAWTAQIQPLPIQSSTDSAKTESEKANSEKAPIISVIANSIANPNELATPSSALRSNVAASLAGSFPEARQNLPRIATSAQPDAKPVTTATFERPSVVPLSAASPVPISTSFPLSNPATTVSVGSVSVPERPGINEANNISQPADPTNESTGKNSPTPAGSPSTPAHAPTAEAAAAATASPTNVSQLNPVSSSGIASGSPQPVAPAAVPLVNPATASQTTSGQPTSSTMPKSSGNLPASPSDSPPNVPAIPETSAAPAPGPVQMAQMVSKAGQSEMRIGLNTSAFGSVEVRTTVHANDVGVVIGSEKGDLHALLANEIPGIANSLQQQNLRLSQVNFQQGAAFSGNQFSGGGSQARYSSPTQTFPSSLPAGERSEEELPTYSEIVPSRSSRLSILA
jgi:hypothetical protein